MSCRASLLVWGLDQLHVLADLCNLYLQLCSVCLMLCLHSTQAQEPLQCLGPRLQARLAGLTSQHCTSHREVYCQARRLPREVLEARVRTTFAPSEYPATLQRLYEWSPDECIPQLYTDERILVSTHPDMPDLAVPAWAAGKRDFIRRHRCAMWWTGLIAMLMHESTSAPLFASSCRLLMPPNPPLPPHFLSLSHSPLLPFSLLRYRLRTHVSTCWSR